jgi:hypothetical protein
MRLVVLNEIATDPDRLEPVLVKGLAEPAAVIGMPLWNDEPRRIHGRF